MAVTLMKFEGESTAPVPRGESACCELRAGEETEALAFLAERPIHTVFLATLIRDNGLVSPLNRGSFLGWRNRSGKLEGVALIGHATIVEARNDEALAAFARLTNQSSQPHLIRGERKTVENFWKYYGGHERQPRLICRELMFEKIPGSQTFEPVPELRPARTEDLEHVLTANALMAFEEGGINPLQKDPSGFRLRTARRIEQGRVWIWVRGGKPMFKADVIGDTPEMIYLEGIHVHPQERLKGYGKRCLAQLSSILLNQTQSICLTSNQRKADAAAFYCKAGFDFHSEYQTIYLR